MGIRRKRTGVDEPMIVFIKATMEDLELSAAALADRYFVPALKQIQMERETYPNEPVDITIEFR